MNTKTEIWNGHSIRFVEKEPGDWWSVAADIADAIGFRDANMATRKMRSEYKGTHKVRTPSGEQDMLILSEKGLYRLIMRSNKPEAEAFQDWVFNVLKTLRQSSGLEAFQVFRMLDKDHQKEAMRQLRDSLKKPVRVYFIKANTIANKAVSAKHGYPKMVKKDQMTPDMLLDRQPILDDTIGLMSANDSFGLGLSVSQTVYAKYCH